MRHRHRWTTETKFEGTCQRRSNMKPHDLMNSWWMLLFQGRFDIRSVIHAWHNVMECKSISWKVAVRSAREWPVGFEVVKIYWEANIVPRAICLNRIIIVHSGGPFAWCAVCVFSVGCESWCSLDAYCMDAYDVRVMTRICFGWMVPAITDENTMPELIIHYAPIPSASVFGGGVLVPRRLLTGYLEHLGYI